MFFGKIFSCTCDLHFKPDILNALNTKYFYQMVFLKKPFPCSPFPQNLKTLKFLYNLVFHQVHIMNIYFHRKGHVFIVNFFWYQLYDYMHPF
jgi:hypothetical protein